MNQPLRILHLEDNPEDTELVRDRLAKEGFACEIRRVETREDFIAEIQQQCGFDIILADYALPSFDGLGALSLARERCPEVPFFFVSGTIGAEPAIEALARGATDYILKDRISRLAPAIRRMLREAESRHGREKAEEELKKSEEAFRLSFEGAEDAIFWVDAGSGTILKCNRAAEKMIEKPRGEIIGKHASSLHPSDLHEQYAAFFKRDMTEKKGFIDDEAVVLSKSGKRIPVHITTSVTRIGDRNIMQGTFRDITDRKRAEEERYQLVSLIENSTDFIALASMDDTMTYVNCAGRKLAGLGDSDDVKATRMTDYLMAEDIPRFRQRMLPDSGWRGEFRVRNLRSGLPVAVDLHTFVIKDAGSGRPIVRAFVMRDITERKRSEEALLTEKKIADSTIDSLPGIFYVMNRSGRLVRWNRNLESVTAYSPEELAGMNPLEFFTGEEREMMARKIEEVFARGLASAEAELTSKNGQKTPCYLTGRGIHLGRDEYLIGMGIDITERKRAEQALQYRVETERLIAASATTLLSLPVEEYDDGIREALQQIGRFFGVDRGCLFQTAENRATMRSAHAWKSTGDGSVADHVQEMDVSSFPWLMERLGRFEPVHIPRVTDLPAAAAEEKSSFETQGIKSLIFVPMISRKMLTGVLRFDSLKEVKTWSREDIKMLEIVSQILVNAIERKEDDEKLRQRLNELERFRSATIQREFRIKELKDRVRALEKRTDGTGLQGNGSGTARP